MVLEVLITSLSQCRGDRVANVTDCRSVFREFESLPRHFYRSITETLGLKVYNVLSRHQMISWVLIKRVKMYAQMPIRNRADDSLFSGRMDAGSLTCCYKNSINVCCFLPDGPICQISGPLQAVPDMGVCYGPVPGRRGTGVWLSLQEFLPQ